MRRRWKSALHPFASRSERRLTSNSVTQERGSDGNGEVEDLQDTIVKRLDGLGGDTNVFKHVEEVVRDLRNNEAKLTSSLCPLFRARMGVRQLTSPFPDHCEKKAIPRIILILRLFPGVAKSVPQDVACNLSASRAASISAIS